MKDMHKDIIDGCREFTFFDLTYKTSSILEKLLWITLGVLGVIWVINVISNLILVFEEGPSIISKGNTELSKIINPAITICYDGSPKYDVAEQLGNYLDPQLELPKQLITLREHILKGSTVYNNDFDNTAIYGKNRYVSDCIKKYGKPDIGCKVYPKTQCDLKTNISKFDMHFESFNKWVEWFSPSFLCFFHKCYPT